MKNELIYHEMSENQRELHHIYDGLEYAHCVMSVGLEGEVNTDYTVKEIIKIQSDICKNLESAMEGIVHLIGAYSELNKE